MKYYVARFSGGDVVVTAVTVAAHTVVYYGGLRIGNDLFRNGHTLPSAVLDFSATLVAEEHTCKRIRSREFQKLAQSER